MNRFGSGDISAITNEAAIPNKVPNASAQKSGLFVFQVSCQNAMIPDTKFFMPCIYLLIDAEGCKNVFQLFEPLSLFIKIAFVSGVNHLLQH